MNDFYKNSLKPHGIPPGNSGAEQGNTGSEPGNKSRPAVMLAIAVAVVLIIMGIVVLLWEK